MNARDSFVHYLNRYAAKDLAGIDALLTDGVTLRDWNIAVRGRAAVLHETQKNFDDARSIQIEVLRLHEAPGSVSGELRIVVDGTIELFVVDVIDFDAAARVTAIRSYKGRGDDHTPR